MQPPAGNLRLIYALTGAATVGLGLLWRSGWLPLSPFLVKYGGDAWWAALVYLLVRFCQPPMTVFKSAMIALLLAFMVEFGQLYHAPWIDAVRRTRIGALALGNTFNWPDLPAYAIGILLVACADGFWLSRWIPRWKRSGKWASMTVE